MVRDEFEKIDGGALQEELIAERLTIPNADAEFGKVRE